MKSLSRLLSLLLLLSSAKTAFAESKGPRDLRRHLTWTSQDESHHLALRGWLTTDLLAFPRTEAGFGRSWHTDLLLRSARVSSRFGLFDDWEGRLDLELSVSTPELQEAWFGWSKFAWLEIKMGRIRVPFGLAQQDQVAFRKLLKAPIIAGNSKDFLDTGIAVNLTVPGGWVKASLAGVTGSRDLAVDVNETPDLALRIRVFPLAKACAWGRDLHFGFSGTYGTGPTRKGFRGRTMGGFTFAEPPTIRGEQWRLAGELAWQTPRFRLAGELQMVHQQRAELSDYQRVGAGYVDVRGLEPYEVWGWYTEASVLLFGRQENNKPLTGLELSGRYEWFSFGDGSRIEETSAGAEDHAPLNDSKLDAFTFGVNGYLLPGVRLTIAYQAARFFDGEIAPDAPEDAVADSPSRWVHHLFLRAQLRI